MLVHVSVVPKFDGSLNFIDCKNNTDAALDEYLDYTKNEWLPSQKEDFMRVFQDIQNNPSKELAEMVIKHDANDLSSYL